MEQNSCDHTKGVFSDSKGLAHARPVDRAAAAAAHPFRLRREPRRGTRAHCVDGHGPHAGKQGTAVGVSGFPLFPYHGDSRHGQRSPSPHGSRGCTGRHPGPAGLLARRETRQQRFSADPRGRDKFEHRIHCRELRDPDCLDARDEGLLRNSRIRDLSG